MATSWQEGARLYKLERFGEAVARGRKNEFEVQEH